VTRSRGKLRNTSGQPVNASLAQSHDLNRDDVEPGQPAVSSFDDEVALNRNRISGQ
jgi:hypothetical protein